FVRGGFGPTGSFQSRRVGDAAFRGALLAGFKSYPRNHLVEGRKLALPAFSRLWVGFRFFLVASGDLRRSAAGYPPRNQAAERRTKDARWVINLAGVSAFVRQR